MWLVVRFTSCPPPRGCTYVVPASDFALALICAQGFGEESEMKVARKLGVTDAEIYKLSDEILMALKFGPLDPDGIRKTIQGALAPRVKRKASPPLFR